VHNDLVRAIDQGQVSALMLLDLSAAFGTVDHDILVTVLDCRCGVNVTAMNRFRSYLGDHTQDIRLQWPAVHRMSGRL
jgi:hypothetical protein